MSLQYSSSYKTETYGQTERVNRGLEQYLRAFTFENPKSWMKFLLRAEYHYNTAFNRSISTSPFEATFGHSPHCLLQYSLGLSSVEAVDSTLSQREQILTALRTHLTKAQAFMKKQVDFKRKDCNFKPGDLVLLRLRPYRQLSVVHCSSQKLAPRFYGPYKVLEQIGQVAFHLELPSDSRIHLVFHASLLRPYYTPTTFNVHHLPSDDASLPPHHLLLAVIAE